mgnify:CR=1 FL=1
MNRDIPFPIRLPICIVALSLLLTACGQKQTEQASSAEGTAAADSSPAPPPPAPVIVELREFDASKLPAETTNKECAVDAVNGKASMDVPEMATGSTAGFGGWAGDGAGKIAAGFHLVLVGAKSYSAPIKIGVARQDVATALNNPDMLDSGYILDFSLANVTLGSYAAFVVDPGNPASACDLKYSFTVK